MLTDLVPSALCAIVRLPVFLYAPPPYNLKRLVVFNTVEPPILTVTGPAYHHVPDEPPFEVNVHLIVEVLFAMLWAVMLHVSFRPTLLSYLFVVMVPLDAIFHRLIIKSMRRTRCRR